MLGWELNINLWIGQRKIAVNGQILMGGTVSTTWPPLPLDLPTLPLPTSIPNKAKVTYFSSMAFIALSFFEAASSIAMA